VDGEDKEDDEITVTPLSAAPHGRGRQDTPAAHRTPLDRGPPSPAADESDDDDSHDSADDHLEWLVFRAYSAKVWRDVEKEVEAEEADAARWSRWRDECNQLQYRAKKMGRKAELPKPPDCPKRNSLEAQAKQVQKEYYLRRERERRHANALARAVS
jgi:hypothetical protein